MSLEETLPFHGEAPARPSGARLIVVLEQGAQVCPLPEAGTVRVGRGEDQDLRIEHPSVSRRHALLHLCGSEAELEDVGSHNGIRSRGERIGAGQRIRLVPGEPVEIGGVLCLLDTGIKEAHGPGSAPLASAPMAPAVLRNPKMAELHDLLHRVARGMVSVLLLGETGAGKEVWARRLHARSQRAERPFVGLNCAALPEGLLEGELFGHERGAFTGALATRPGLFEAAHGGTLFLDEIGDLPLSLQAKLLRVLEDGKVRRLGATAERAVDFRLVAATNRDIFAESQAGRFRADLYYRVAGCVLRIPPLRERTEEIEPLALQFTTEAARRSGLAVAPALSEPVLDELRRRRWPGNIRELRNAIERAVLIAGEGPVRPEHLPEPEGEVAPSGGTASALIGQALSAASEMPEGLSAEQASERQRILEALGRAAGNQTRAADTLGMSRRWLSEKMNRYGILRSRRRD
jgi:two-component system, NtrC family, response regulator AtoC